MDRELRRCLPLLGWFVVSFATADDVPAAADAPRTLTIDDFGSVITPQDVAISPDGKWVAFASDDQIRVVPRAGGEVRAITSASSVAWSPTWSHDGESLYFVSDRGEHDQLYRLPVGSFGEAVQVTELPHDLPQVLLSPDETRLLMSLDDAQRSPPDEAKKRKEPFVIDRLEFKVDAGDGYLTARPSDHIFVYDMEARELVQLTSGDYAETEPAWSPDGEHVVFVSNREANPDASYKNDLWRIPAAPGDTKQTPVRLTSDDGVKGSPQWSPDGRFIAFLYAVDGVYGVSQLALIPAQGGPVTYLTRSLDRWVRSFRFSSDGRWIWFNYDDGGGVHLARVRVNDGHLETRVDGSVSVDSFSVSDNGHVAAAIAEGNQSFDVYSVGERGTSRLTTLNRQFFDHVRLGEKTEVSFESADGTEVEAFVTLPPDYQPGRRYPAILRIHGGPVGQFSWGYDFGTQYYAAHGYVVIEPNPRGSTGRGQNFIRAIYRTWGITDYDDVIAAVDHAIEAGLADPERLAVTGYSYGGYMTNVVITRTDRFAAAASGAGHSLISANYGHDIYQKWYNWELGPPWEFAERYEQLSPLLRVGAVTTPTLFLGGRDDWNVPVLNAELFYQSLKQRGVDTRLVVYPDTHHGGWSEEFGKDYLVRVIDWFDRHLAVSRETADRGLAAGR